MSSKQVLWLAVIAALIVGLMALLPPPGEQGFNESEAGYRERMQERMGERTQSGDYQICAQVITYAQNPETGSCVAFPTPCDVPTGWAVGSCSPTVIRIGDSPNTMLQWMIMRMGGSL